MMEKPLTDAQKELLKQAGSEWRQLPVKVSCANRTLRALEDRGLVEVRFVPEMGKRFTAAWQWRATGSIA